MGNQPSDTQALDSRLAYPINDLAEAIGIGRSKIYAEIAAGRLRAVKIGARTVVPADAVRAYLSRLPEARAA